MASVKERCLADMRESFAELEAVLNTIPPERLTDVGVTDEWSPRDMLAHMAGYERYVSAAMFGDLTGVPPTARDFYGRDDEPTPEDDANDDTTNAWVVNHARTLPVESVMAEFRWAHGRLMEAVEACEEGDLEDPHRFPSFNGKSALQVLPNQCWAHHREHIPQLEAFARGQPAV